MGLVKALAKGSASPNGTGRTSAKGREFSQSAFDPLRTSAEALSHGDVKSAFDVNLWADWALKRTTELQGHGEQASFTFAEAAKVSDNPAFFVDFDNANAVGRIIFWSTGDYDLTVQQRDAAQPNYISGWPKLVANENFEEVFGRFVALVRALS